MPAETPTKCPRCGKRLKRPLDKAQPHKKYQCLDCDGIDPIKTQDVQGWLNSELAKSPIKKPEE